METDALVLPLSTEWLMEEMGCLDRDPWNGGPPFRAEEIDAAPLQSDPYRPPEVQSRTWHAGRIMYLALYPSDNPVQVEVSFLGQVDLEDGYHRLHAAHLCYRDRVIAGEVFGFIDNLPDEALERRQDWAS